MSALLSALVPLVMAGCASASLRSYVDPALASGAIRSVAILPVRNARLLPDESRELNREFARHFQETNPSVRLVGPAEATDALNTARLTERYTDFLRDFSTSGIPNARTLREIGDSLNVDAIVQGEVFDVQQRDTQLASSRGETSVTVRYALLGVSKGMVLWEGTSAARKTATTTLSRTPPLYEVISIAQKRILESMPRFGNGGLR